MSFRMIVVDIDGNKIAITKATPGFCCKLQ